MIKILKWFSTVIVILFCQNSVAERGAFFQVSADATTINVRTTVAHHNYPSVGIKLKTSGYSLSHIGSDCTMAKNGYCLFSASSTTTKKLSVSGVPGVLVLSLCLNGEGPLTCQEYAVIIKANRPAHKAYITNGDNIVSLCPIQANGSFGVCVDAGAAGLNTTFMTPRGIALNNAGSLAYVVNNGDDIVQVCRIGALGAFSSCVDSGGTGFDGPDGLALNPAGTFAYISNVGPQTVSLCPINLDGSFGVCIDSGRTGLAFSQPRGIAINPTNTFAYVANYGDVSSVYRCPIRIDGTLGACDYAVSGGGSFSGAFGIALNPTGTRAYVTNNNNDTVSVCSIDRTTGEFVTCLDSGNTGVAFNGLNGISVNAEGTLAYVANGATNAILACPIQPNGLFGVCLNSGSSGLGFVSPVFLALS